MKNWIKIGGIAGIILIALILLNTIKYYLFLIGAFNVLGYINNLSFFPFFLLSNFLLILLYLGFLFVARKYNKKFLKITLLLILISYAIAFIPSLVSDFLPYFHAQFLSFFTSRLYTYSFMGIYSIIGILELLFGIGLITLRKINKLSFVTGILILADFIIGMIISGFILINQISQIQHAGSIYFISIISSIFSIVITLLEVIILFQLSEYKLKKRKK